MRRRRSNEKEKRRGTAIQHNKTAGSEGSGRQRRSRSMNDVRECSRTFYQLTALQLHGGMCRVGSVHPSLSRLFTPFALSLQRVTFARSSNHPADFILLQPVALSAPSMITRCSLL